VKLLSARLVALLCVVSCTTVAALEIWPGDRRTRAGDQNHDGRADIWRRYDSRGQLTEIDVDSNFDGSPDIEEYYRGGVLVRRNSDRDFNGQTDLVEEFDPETHGQTRSVVDVDYDGIADLLVLFRDGRPVFSKRTLTIQSADLRRRIVPAALRRDAVALAPLADPFESDSSVRGTHLPTIDHGCVGLSLSGGLPCPRIVAVSRLSPSAQCVGSHTPPYALTFFASLSSRAPPVS